MIEQDMIYYRRRAAEELLAAHSATSEAARIRHQQLAAAYDVRVRDLQAMQRRAAFEIIAA